VTAIGAPTADGEYLAGLLQTDFTDEQLAIITAPLAPQLVIAGAGSGKTTVMAGRVVHAVAWYGLAPSQVLGLTFTNKAAAELAARVRQSLGRLCEAGGTQLPAAADDPATVSTYHAYAARLLADHALRIGREPRSRLLTEAGRWQLAGRVVRQAQGPFPHLAWLPATVTGYVLDLDAELSEHLVDPADVRRVDRRLIDEIGALTSTTQDVRDVVAAARSREELLDLVEAYRRRKRQADAVDFGDQVALAAEIAGGWPQVGQVERAEHRLVLLDEYQDTGVGQRVLLSRLYGTGHAVTAVGDPCQSIYGWRGASVGNLLRFFEHFGAPATAGGPVAAEPLQLSTNFRSGGRLLAVANAVSAELRSPRAGSRRPYVPVRALVAPPGAETAGETRCALLSTADEEADWVAEQVAEAVAEGVRPGEVAVLCRRRVDFPRLHGRLVARGLPVEVVGLGGLLDLPEVADVVATLEVLIDPTANAALVRLLTGPRWAIGLRDLAALGRRARQLVAGGPAGPASADPAPGADLARATAGVDASDVVSLSEAMESPGDPGNYSAEALTRIAALAAEIRRLRRVLEQPVVQAVQEVILGIGLDVELLAGGPEQAVAGGANLAAFADHAAHFTGVEGEADLRAFLNWLTAAREAEDGLDIGAVSTADTVKLLTVHKAKGLEWDVVAVPGLVCAAFPSDRGRSLWTGAARVLPHSLRGDAGDLPADPADWTSAAVKAFRAGCKAEDVEEERRLGYVALTRARRLLLASGYRWSATRAKPCEPAPYLVEVRDALVAGGSDAMGWAAPPEPDEPNPMQAEVEDSSWPPRLDQAALARRRSAAALVNAALAGEDLLGGVQLSEDELAAMQRWQADADLLLAELARERQPVRDVELPRALTTSQVVRLRADPAGLARDLARPMPRPPSAAARRGTRFHTWVQEMFTERPLIAAEDLGGQGELPTDEGLAALKVAFERSAYAGIRPYRVEVPFQLVAGAHLVRGRIDAVYAAPDGGWDVIDYKTGRRPRDPAAADLQLAVYRLAWAGLAGVPLDRVTAGFLYVATGEVIRPAELPDVAGLAGLLDGAGGPAD